ncbi:Protein ROOT INITIATION DEFECTIVE 3 [Camellia lanceoleosa]|uniref:Protein ROOT INITIATION DEFECTIVE 3 n=1 Tax=Camellia lanceoleosa TaxID=1840588 RepID=A0ACC0I1I5_9ERIC|nr:Protein ROOT INITIATION DEFECTIVE 3 [Camellia lanceoleosa]
MVMDFDFCEFVCDWLILFGIVEFADLSRGALIIGKAVTCLAFAADGVLLVSSYEDGMVRVWDTKTHNIIRVLKHAKGVFCWFLNHNLNSPKFQSSIFGTVVPGKSSPLSDKLFHHDCIHSWIRIPKEATYYYCCCIYSA